MEIRPSKLALQTVSHYVGGPPSFGFLRHSLVCACRAFSFFFIDGEKSKKDLECCDVVHVGEAP